MRSVPHEPPAVRCLPSFCHVFASRFSLTTTHSRDQSLRKLQRKHGGRPGVTLCSRCSCFWCCSCCTCCCCRLLACTQPGMHPARTKKGQIKNTAHVVASISHQRSFKKDATRYLRTDSEECFCGAEVKGYQFPSSVLQQTIGMPYNLYAIHLLPRPEIYPRHVWSVVSRWAAVCCGPPRYQTRDSRPTPSTPLPAIPKHPRRNSLGYPAVSEECSVDIHKSIQSGLPTSSVCFWLHRSRKVIACLVDATASEQDGNIAV